MRILLRTLLPGFLLASILTSCESTQSPGGSSQPSKDMPASSSHAGQDPGLPDDPNMPWSNSYGCYPWDDYPF